MMTPIQQQRQQQRRERIFSLVQAMVITCEDSKSLMSRVSIPKADITELSIHLHGFFNALDEDSEGPVSTSTREELMRDIQEVLEKHGLSNDLPMASSGACYDGDMEGRFPCYDADLGARPDFGARPSHPGYDDFRREGGRFGG